jgi:hypothetical protein
MIATDPCTDQICTASGRFDVTRSQMISAQFHATNVSRVRVARGTAAQKQLSKRGREQLRAAAGAAAAVQFTNP